MRRRSEVGGSRVRHRRLRPATVRDAMLVALSFAAGCVDAVGYLGLGQVFVANMTGNTVLLGLAIGQWDGRAALQGGTALAGFVVGVAIGAALAGQGRTEDRTLWPVVVTVVLSLELLVLVAFAMGWILAGAEPTGRATYALISLSALAMGLQSTAVRRLGIPGVATTYITGTLTSLTEEVIGRLRSAVSSAAVSDGHSEERPKRSTASARGLLLPADVWLAYGTGAVVAGAIALRWPSGAVLPPVAVVMVVVAFATAHHRRHEEG